MHLSDKSYLVVAAMFGRSLTIVATAILARLLTPGDYGLFALFISTTAWLGLINGHNLDQTLAIWKGEFSEMYHSVIIVAGSILLICVTVAVTSGYLLAIVHDSTTIWTISLIMALGYVVGPLYNLQLGFLSRELSFRSLAINDLTVAGAALIVGVVAAVWLQNSLALAMQAVLPVCLSIVLLKRYLWIEFPLKATVKGIKFAIKHGTKQSLGNFLDGYTLQAVILITALTYSFAEIGLLSQAIFLRATIISLLLIPLTRVLIPKFAQSSEDINNNIFPKAVLAVSMISIPIGGYLFVNGDLLVLLFLGTQWQLTADLISIFGLSVPIVLCASPARMYLVATGQQKYWIVSSFIALTLLVTGLLQMTALTLKDMAVYTVVIECLYGLVLLLIVHHLRKINFGVIKRLCIQLGLVAIAIIGVGWLRLNLWQELHILPKFVLSSGLYFLFLISAFLTTLRKESNLISELLFRRSS